MQPLLEMLNKELQASPKYRVDEDFNTFWQYLQEELLDEAITVMKSPDKLLQFSSSQQANKLLTPVLSKYGLNRNEILLKQIKEYEEGDEDEYEETIYVKKGKGRKAVMQLHGDNGLPLKPEKYIVLTGDLVKYIRGAQQSSNLHELAVGIFLKLPNAKIDSMEELNVLANNVYKDADLSSIKEYDQNLIDDARVLANKFIEKFGKGKPTEVIWTAATTKENMQRYAPADIVIKYTGKEEDRISLKKGKAQLASMSPADITAIINTEYGESLGEVSRKGGKGNYIDWLYSFQEHRAELDEMAERWAKLLLEFDESEEVKEEIEKISKWPDWKAFQRSNKDKAEQLADLVTKDSKTKKEWINIRKETIMVVLAERVGNRLEDARDESIKKLYKKIFQIREYPFYYLGDAGKKIIKIPSEDEFEEKISYLLSFEAEAYTEHSDFQVVVKVGKKDSRKEPLLKFFIQFRWTKKQMIGSLSVVANRLQFLNQEAVEELIFPSA